MSQFIRRLARIQLAPASLVPLNPAPVQPTFSPYRSACPSISQSMSAHTAPGRPADTGRPTGRATVSPSPDRGDDDETFHRFVSEHPKLLAFRQAHPSIIPTRSALIPSKDHLAYNLTCTTLSGADLIQPQPYVFTADEAGSVIAFYRLGRRLAGHAGIVHGGVSAALLDECMCRACFPRLPAKIAVTAKLEVEYKAPVPVGSTVVIRAETVRVEGRKAYVSAWVEDAKGKGGLYVRAEGLFVEPRWAGEMASIF